MKKAIPPLITRLYYGALVCFCCLFLSSVVHGQERLFPADAGVIDIKSAPYNAKGDGVTDDSDAIQAAIRANLNSKKIIYFPDGVYKVTKRLEWRKAPNADGTYTGISYAGWGCWLTFQGQSRTGTIIKLEDGAPGFGDTATPKAVVYTASKDYDHTNAYSDANGEGNLAFGNYIKNLTVDVGNNPGAIGIDFQVSNHGAIYDVTIKGNGHTGLSMTRRDNGPGLVKNVTIEGFATGIRTKGITEHVTFEFIKLENQGTLGWNNQTAALSIRKLTSINNVPVIHNTDNGHIAFVDGVFTGGTEVAINNSAFMLLRNINSSGYTHVVSNNGVNVAGTSVNEWTSDGVLTLNQSARTTLNLPIEETPVYYDNNFANWEKVSLDPAGIDDTPFIQAAFNSGKSTIYFPKTRNYIIKSTIIIPASVKHIMGMDSRFAIASTFVKTDPVFRFSGGSSSNQTTFEGINEIAGPEANNAPSVVLRVEHADARTLILKHINFSVHNTYLAQPGAGKLFCDDIICKTMKFSSGQKVWMRQLNPEGGGDSYLTNEGGILWILGIKTESKPTVITTLAGGKTEVLGGFLYPVTNESQTPVAFKNIDSEVSLSYATWGISSKADYNIQVEETKSGITNRLYKCDVANRQGGSAVSLYAGHGISDSNLPPQVSITMPLNNTYYFNPANIAFNVDASDNTGTVTKVELYSGCTKIGEDVSSPYNFTLTGLTNGTYTYKVKAYDNLGAITTSSSITINVTDPLPVTTPDSIPEDLITLEPIADAFVSDVSGARDVNYGLSPTLLVKKFTGGGGRESFIRFDLSKVKGPITEAKLRLYGHQTAVDAGTEIGVYKVGDIVWEETKVNWYSRPAMGAKISGVNVISTPWAYYTWDVAGYIQEEFNAGRKIITLGVKGTVDEEIPFLYASKEANTGHPVLILNGSLMNEAPNVPTGLNLTGKTATSVTLSWTAATGNIGVISYEIFVNGISAGTSTTTTYTASGLTCNTAYSFTVRAKDEAGNVSDQSSALSVTTSACTTLRDPENPANTTAGLEYKYYEGSWNALPVFSSLTPVKSGNATGFDLSLRNINDNFAFSFTGFVNIPADGTYTFYTSSDDGSKLYIGTTQVVNNDGLHGIVEKSGSIGLKAGKHAITVTFFEKTGGESLVVRYSSSSISKTIIPASALFRLSQTFTLEAEQAIRSGVLVASTHAGYTGTGYTDYNAPSGEYTEWSANIATAGTYTLEFRYALSAATRNLEVRVNGTVASSALAFTNTGSWSSWNTKSVTVALNAGVNTIRLSSTGTSGPNVDHLKITEGSSTSRIADEEIAAASEVEVYPNPADNVINVSLYADQESEAKLIISSMEGRNVRSFSRMLVRGLNHLSINVGDVQNGIYLLKIQSVGKTSVRKVIITR